MHIIRAKIMSAQLFCMVVSPFPVFGVRHQCSEQHGMGPAPAPGVMPRFAVRSRVFELGRTDISVTIRFGKHVIEPLTCLGYQPFIPQQQSASDHTVQPVRILFIYFPHNAVCIRFLRHIPPRDPEGITGHFEMPGQTIPLRFKELPKPPFRANGVYR